MIGCIFSWKKCGVKWIICVYSLRKILRQQTIFLHALCNSVVLKDMENTGLFNNKQMWRVLSSIHPEKLYMMCNV